jgi:hypothetical protein
MAHSSKDEQINRSVAAARSAMASDLTALEEPAGATGRAARHDDSDQVLEHYFRRIDPRVAASFTAPQRQALKSILGLRGRRRHAVEVRRDFGLGFNRYYLVFLLGRDRRILARLHRERGSGVAAAARYLGLILLFLLPVIGLVYFG